MQLRDSPPSTVIEAPVIYLAESDANIKVTPSKSLSFEYAVVNHISKNVESVVVSILVRREQQVFSPGLFHFFEDVGQFAQVIGIAQAMRAIPVAVRLPAAVGQCVGERCQNAEGVKGLSATVLVARRSRSAWSSPRHPASRPRRPRVCQFRRRAQQALPSGLNPWSPPSARAASALPH